MDLSYILNSPDVERVAVSLESIATNAVSAITNKLDKNQGTANAGQVLKVGPDGQIATETLAAVLYDVAQSLTAAQKAQARSNIGASNADITVNGTTLVIQHITT